MADIEQDPDIDAQSDDDVGEYDDETQSPYQNNDQQNSGIVSVNGITYEELQQGKIARGDHHKLGQCMYCQKFYYKALGGMMTYDFDPSGEGVCYHCIFWINYNIDTRPMVDGAFGKTIVEYIVECKDSHDKESCTRDSAEGGCFLCDCLNGKPIEGIIGGEMFDQKESTSVSKSVADDEYSFKICI